MQNQLEEKFEATLTRELMNNEDFEINSRWCSNDDYDGVEYTFKGSFIPIISLIDVVGKEDDLYIEELCFVDENESCLKMFVVEPSEPSHPAFM